MLKTVPKRGYLICTDEGHIENKYYNIYGEAIKRANELINETSRECTVYVLELSAEIKKLHNWRTVITEFGKVEKVES